MQVNIKIGHFTQLGKIMKAVGNDAPYNLSELGILEDEYKRLSEAVRTAHVYNGWFTEKEVRKAFLRWGTLLEREKLEQWVRAYDFKTNTSKNVLVVAAGNIPLVGFHDILTVLLSGNRALIKLSSDDNKLIPELLRILTLLDEGFAESFVIYEALEKVKNYDAVIATGNNNSARYFDYYFGNYPNIIRKNRVSVAFIRGDESEEDFKLLGKDIFDYYGLGCRNVSHLLLPQDFDLNRIFGAITDYGDVIYNKKYANNYDYHKAIFLMNQENLLENGFMLMRESKELHAPLSIVNYQRYSNVQEAKDFLEQHKNDIQAVVGKDYIPFGSSQEPALNDYADGVDTMQFLIDDF